MDLTYIDKIAKDKESVKFLLVRQDLFDRTVNCKRNENKSFQGNGSWTFDYDF